MKKKREYGGHSGSMVKLQRIRHSSSLIVNGSVLRLPLPSMVVTLFQDFCGEVGVGVGVGGGVGVGTGIGVGVDGGVGVGVGGCWCFCG